jgi:hypothetical protein
VPRTAAAAAAAAAADLSPDEYESDEDVGYRRISVDTQA